MVDGIGVQAFVNAIAERYKAAPVGTLLNAGVQQNLGESVQALAKAGAELMVGGEKGGGEGFCYRNTLLRTTGAKFLPNADAMQREAFGNASVMVLCKDAQELQHPIAKLHGNLTGT